MGNRYEVKFDSPGLRAAEGTMGNGSKDFFSAFFFFSITSFPTKKGVNLKADTCNDQSKAWESQVHDGCSQCWEEA